MRILIADDHPFMRAGVEAVLRRAKFEIVASVSNGIDALRAIALDAPDVAVLDVTMPAPDGVEVLEKLRAAGDNQAVVLLTAQIDDQQLMRAMRCHVDGIVLKEGAEDTLVSCLQAIARGERKIDPELMQRAVDLSLRPPPKGFLEGLAPRERDVALRVARGMRNREIANALNMSEGTVKTYLHEVYEKLGIHSRTELALLVANANP